MEKVYLPVITSREKCRSSSCAKSRKEGTYLFSVVFGNLESTLHSSRCFRMVKIEARLQFVRHRRKR